LRAEFVPDRKARRNEQPDVLAKEYRIAGAVDDGRVVETQRLLCPAADGDEANGAVSRRVGIAVVQRNADLLEVARAIGVNRDGDPHQVVGLRKGEGDGQGSEHRPQSEVTEQPHFCCLWSRDRLFQRNVANLLAV
jgi:hypothetical protein